MARGQFALQLERDFFFLFFFFSLHRSATMILLIDFFSLFLNVCILLLGDHCGIKIWMEKSEAKSSSLEEIWEDIIEIWKIFLVSEWY